MKSKLVVFEGVKLWTHEVATIMTLRKHGLDVKPVMPTGTICSADVMIGNRLWEIKCPKGNSRKSTIKSQFDRGKKQSRYLIIDARRTKLSDVFIEKEIRRQLGLHAGKNIKGTVLIRKNVKIVEILNNL